MAVFTEVTPDDAQQLLSRYNVGDLVELTGITQGVENTNYILQTTDNKLILTLIERRVDASELNFFTELLTHLHEGAIPCPMPVLPQDGQPVSLHGKPVLMVSFLEGIQHPDSSPQDAASLGMMTAKMHRSLAELPATRANPIGPEAWLTLLDRFGNKLSQFDADLPELARKVATQAAETWDNIPNHQLIHADIFTDNVFFNADQVSGLIDWYFTCTAPRSYELAIMLCDWCFDKQNHQWLPEHAAALLNAYQNVTPLTDAELTTLPFLCQAAALRFLLTRAEDMFFPRADADVVMKDPQEYVKKLQFFFRSNANIFSDAVSKAPSLEPDSLHQPEGVCRSSNGKIA